MKIFKGIKIAVFVMSVAMIGISSYFLINPTNVLAAGCQAKCTNGVQNWEVKCNGNSTCTATDNSGCISDTEWKSCNGTSGKVPSDEFVPESGGDS